MFVTETERPPPHLSFVFDWDTVNDNRIKNKDGRSTVFGNKWCCKNHTKSQATVNFIYIETYLTWKNAKFKDSILGVPFLWVTSSVRNHQLVIVFMILGDNANGKFYV